jgi:hypothetical protein
MKTEHIPQTWRFEKRADGIAVFNDAGKPKCGAKCRDGHACTIAPIKGKYRCKKHGGHAVVGEAHGMFKDGTKSRYFRFIPPRLQSRYLELAANPDMNNLSENIAVLDLRLSELMNRMEIGEFGASYNALRTLHVKAQRDMTTAFEGTNPLERREALERFIDFFNQMGELIGKGQKDYHTWQQVLEVSAERRQQVKTMSDIEHKGENAVPVAQLMAAFAQFDNLFKRVNRLEDSMEREKEMASGIHKIINFAG